MSFLWWKNKKNQSKATSRITGVENIPGVWVGNEGLFLAAHCGSISDVKRMLSEGVNVNGKIKFGRTALMAAAENGYSNIIKVLLNNGADVNSKDDYGRTALMYAAENGHNGIVNLLKEG